MASNLEVDIPTLKDLNKTLKSEPAPKHTQNFELGRTANAKVPPKTPPIPVSSPKSSVPKPLQLQPRQQFEIHTSATLYEDRTILWGVLRSSGNSMPRAAFRFDVKPGATKLKLRSETFNVTPNLSMHSVNAWLAWFAIDFWKATIAGSDVTYHGSNSITNAMLKGDDTAWKKLKPLKTTRNIVSAISLDLKSLANSHKIRLESLSLLSSKEAKARRIVWRETEANLSEGSEGRHLRELVAVSRPEIVSMGIHGLMPIPSKAIEVLAGMSNTMDTKKRNPS